MEIQQVTGQIITLLKAGRSIDGAGRSESALTRGLENLRAGESSRDSLTIRLNRLGLARSELNEVRDALNIGQTRLKIVQTAKGAANSIRAEVEEIERLTAAVSEGEVAESQLEDVQRMIDLRLARIEETASQASYAGNPLLTGESVVVTTDVISGEGFSISLPEMSVESMGLDELDLVNMESEEAVEVVSEALSSLDSAVSRISTEESRIQEEMEGQMGELLRRFAEMRSRETLDAPEESRWIESSGGTDATPGTLKTILPSGTLDADVVASLLK